MKTATEEDEAFAADLGKRLDDIEAAHRAGAISAVQAVVSIVAINEELKEYERGRRTVA